MMSCDWWLVYEIYIFFFLILLIKYRRDKTKQGQVGSTKQEKQNETNIQRSKCINCCIIYLALSPQCRFKTSALPTLR